MCEGSYPAAEAELQPLLNRLARAHCPQATLAVAMFIEDVLMMHSGSNDGTVEAIVKGGHVLTVRHTAGRPTLKRGPDGKVHTSLK